MIAVPALTSSDVHLWVISLDSAEWRQRFTSASLSDDELERAGGYRFEELCRRFVMCRSTVRAILGHYVGRDPRALRFRPGRYGKPCLDPDVPGRATHFNVSHSHEIALLAVSLGGDLGVDVEQVRPREGIDDIVALHFAAPERLALERAPRAARLAMFYRYWTLKEACLKAAGVGMNAALRALDVSAACEGAIRLPGSLTAEPCAWWTAPPLEPHPGYVAALVGKGAKPLPVTRLTVTGIAPTFGRTSGHNG